jgi:putative heme-binding domain-containing protein
VGALYNLPAEMDDATRDLMISLDQRIATREGGAFERLKLGLVAVFARAGDAESMAYLRKVWDRDPERRQVVAMGLAQQPGGGNWEYLLRSLPVIEGEPARVVLSQLRTVPYGPNDAEYYRQAILCGLRLDEQGAAEAVELLNYWTGGTAGVEGDTPDSSLAAWQTWFHTNYPDHPPAEIPVAASGSKYQYDELLAYLGADGAKADATRGAVVFEKAQCAKCHRYGSYGKSAGPDLTSVGKRFTRRELLESILFPSHVISDQYATKSIITTGGRTFTGMVGDAGDQFRVLTEDGRIVTVEKDQVDEVIPVAKSSMPEGLLNDLELQEIADLFEFLESSAPAAMASPPSGGLR